MTQPHSQRCIHYKVCTLNNAVVREILPKGKCSFLWCEDPVRISNEGQCPHTTHTLAAPASRLCDDCEIIAIEQKVIELEQQVKDEREQVLDAIDKAIMKKETWSRLELLAIIAEQKSFRGGAP